MPYKDEEKQKLYQRNRCRKIYQQRKELVLKLLGGHCVKCLTDDFRVLEIDHIEPILRDTSNRKSGSNLYELIFRERLPIKDVQLLCANCHRIKTFEDRVKFKNYIK